MCRLGKAERAISPLPSGKGRGERAFALAPTRHTSPPIPITLASLATRLCRLRSWHAIISPAGLKKLNPNDGHRPNGPRMDDQRPNRESGRSMTEEADYRCGKCGSADLEVVHTKIVIVKLVTRPGELAFDRLELQCRQCGEVGVLFRRKEN